MTVEPSSSPAESKWIDALFDAWRNLQDRFGWRNMMYAPKDRTIEIIELGSTGIHRVRWAEFTFFTEDDEGWPTHPVLWREVLGKETGR